MSTSSMAATGNDTVSYKGQAVGITAGVTINLTKQGENDGSATPISRRPARRRQGGDAEGDLLWNIENVTGSDRNDILTGNDDENVHQGRAGRRPH